MKEEFYKRREVKTEEIDQKQEKLMINENFKKDQKKINY